MQAEQKQGRWPGLVRPMTMQECKAGQVRAPALLAQMLEGVAIDMDAAVAAPALALDVDASVILVDNSDAQ